METGTWNEGVNFGDEMCLSMVEVERKIVPYIRADCIVCKCLFGLFGAFAVKVRNW